MNRIIIALILLSCLTSAMAQQITHVIQRGETIERIAEKYNVSVSAIKDANPNLEPYYVGVKIVIPNQVPDVVSTSIQDTVKVEQIKTTDTYRRETVILDNNKSGFVNGDGTFVHFAPNNKTYGIDIASNFKKYLFGTCGLSGTFIKNASVLDWHLGLGLGTKFVANPMIFMVNIYPYISFNTHDEIVNMNEVANGKKPKVENKLGYSYGARAEFGLGINIFQSRSKKFYLSGGYRVDTPKFKMPDDLFKSGNWFAGLVYVGF